LGADAHRTDRWGGGAGGSRSGCGDGGAAGQRQHKHEYEKCSSYRFHSRYLLSNPIVFLKIVPNRTANRETTLPVIDVCKGIGCHRKNACPGMTTTAL
jgi:hypothetical protein